MINFQSQEKQQAALQVCVVDKDEELTGTERGIRICGNTQIRRFRMR